MILSIKKKFVFLVFLFLAMVLIPLLSVRGQNEKIDLFGKKNHEEGFADKTQPNNFFCILDESANKVIKISDREFLYGAVACEMPAGFEEEALKAQCVACYTYFCRERNAHENKKDKAYEFTADTSKWINYVTKEQMERKWGADFEKYYEKIKKCVDSVYREVIEEDGDLILAAYHAISSGKTEACKDVFGGDLKYLTNVESPGDKLAQGYESKVEIAKDKFKEIIESECEALAFENQACEWAKEPLRSSSGMVKEINICGHTFKGTQIRKIFGLRSSDFDIAFNQEENKFIFTVRGYGHGVGMSQCGAQYMAKQGCGYKEILQWYYPNTLVVKLA